MLPNERSGSRGSLPALTSLRFVAAAMIVIGHADPQFGSLGLATAIPLNQGVSFFFVLSGFILYYNYPNFQTFSQVYAFIVARLARIWPSQITCTFLFLLWVPEKLWYIPYPGPSLRTLLVLNLLMIQVWFPLKQIILSLNGVSWSISCEMFFYACFPLLVVYRRYWLYQIAGIILVAVLTAIFIVHYGVPVVSERQGLTSLGLLYTNPLVRILEFLAGILVARAFLATRESGVSRLAANILELGSVALVIFVLWMMPTISGDIWRVGRFGPVLGYWLVNEGAFPVFAVLIFVMARQEGVLSRALSMPALVFLGEASFAVYLLHQIILRSWPVRFEALLSLPNFVQYVVFWCILLAAASVFHMLIERPARKTILRMTLSRRPWPEAASTT